MLISSWLTYANGHESQEENVQIAFPRLLLLLHEPDEKVEDLRVGELEADIHLQGGKW